MTNGAEHVDDIKGGQTLSELGKVTPMSLYGCLGSISSQCLKFGWIKS